jgi:hypothetical protein
MDAHLAIMDARASGSLQLEVQARELATKQFKEKTRKCLKELDLKRNARLEAEQELANVDTEIKYIMEDMVINERNERRNTEKDLEAEKKLNAKLEEEVQTTRITWPPSIRRSLTSNSRSSSMSEMMQTCIKNYLLRQHPKES